MLITERVGDMIHAYSTSGAIYLDGELVQQATIPFDQAERCQIKQANMVDMLRKQQEKLDWLTMCINSLMGGGEINAN